MCLDPCSLPPENRKNLPRRHALLLFLVLIPGFAQNKSGRLIRANRPPPQEQMLEVRISIFDSRLKKSNKEALKWALESESRTIPLRLMETMQASLNWGSVRVVPPGHPLGEVRVTGTIRYLTGLRLFVIIEAVDATGNRWFRRRYKQLADPSIYLKRWYPPFQPLLNRIANDLLAARMKHKTKQLQRIRQVETLRFAASLAPNVFSDYLKVTDGFWGKRYRIRQLPSSDDPMMARVAQLRIRDDLLVDTLTEQFLDYRDRSFEFSEEWLRFSFDAENALLAFRRSLFINLSISPGFSSKHFLRLQNMTQKDFMVLLQSQNTFMDKTVAPLLLDLDGRTVQLTGSAQTQYNTWRKLLAEIFAEETSLPLQDREKNLKAN